MNLGGTANVPGGSAKMEMAHHSSSLPDGTYAGPAASWLLDVGGKRLFIAGDTCLFSDMERIGKPDSQGRQLDLAILPIGDMFTMGPTDALEAIRLLRLKVCDALSFWYVASYRAGRGSMERNVFVTKVSPNRRYARQDSP